jgi:erythromycin esterase-like protein
MQEVALLDQQLQTGNGDPRAFVRGLAEIEEALDLFEWMMAYNSNHSSDKISLQGIDFTGSVSLKQDNILDFLAEIDPEKAAWAESQMNCIADHVEEKFANYYRSSEEEKTGCLENIERVYDDLLSEQESYVALTSESEYSWALQNLRLLIQQINTFSDQPFSLAYNITRDRYLAENISWLLESAEHDARMVVWAHNDHIANNNGAGQYPRMGLYLKEEYRDAYIIIGLTTYQGTFTSLTQTANPQPIVYDLPLAPHNSFNHYLHAAGIPLFMLDLHLGQAGETETEWLFSEQRFLRLGNIFIDKLEHYYPFSHLAEYYDFLFYVDTTTHSNPLKGE